MAALAPGGGLCRVGELGHAQAGPVARAEGWSAAMAVLLGWQGFHALVLLLMAGFRRALVDRPAHRPAVAVRDNVALFWLYAAVQGLAAALLVQALPRLIGV